MGSTCRLLLQARGNGWAKFLQLHEFVSIVDRGPGVALTDRLESGHGSLRDDNSGACFTAMNRTRRLRFAMNKRPPIPRQLLPELPERARRHFKSIAILSELDKAESQATHDQFAVAARIAARAVCNARNKRMW
jgi:hypothetical protein